MSAKASRLRNPLARFFDESDDAVEALGSGVGETSFDEDEDSVVVFSHRTDELFWRLQTAPFRRLSSNA